MMLKKAINTYFQNKRQYLISKYVLLLRSKTFLIVSLIIFGTVVWSLTMFKSGLLYSFGVGYWGPNGHDGIWHVALAESLSQISLNNPVFAGEEIKNYHLGFDLILSILHKLTLIPISVLYFQIIPPILAILIGLLTYKFVLNWRNSKSEAFWATAFVYFGSGFGFVVTLLRDGLVTGESMFWSQQSISTLVNPPYALSLVFILSGLIVVQKKNLLLSIIFFGLLIQIKAYAAILVLGALFVTSIYAYYIQHNTYYIRTFVGSLILNLILFSLVKNDSLSVFSWQPFWFLETMMSYSDRLGWQQFYSAMTTYKMGHVWIKGIIAYLSAFVIFIIGNMGTRIIGMCFFYKILNKQEKVDSSVVFISSILVAGVIIPMFFVQSGTPWNTIQFFYYFLFFFSMFAGIIVSSLNKKYLTIFVLFALLGAWSTLQHYLPPMPQSMVSTSELEALNFLRTQPHGIVLTYPFDEHKSNEAKFSPRPLHLYVSTAYVSAFSSKTIYMEDEVNLNIMGYKWNTRRQEILNWYKEKDQIKSREFLTSNNIKYVYWVKPHQRALLGETELGLEKIFENKDYQIFKYE